MNSWNQQGTILIVTLIFCAVISLFIKTTLEMGMLQLKMSANFKENLFHQWQTQAQLKKLENQVETNWEPGIQARQFVPDTLAFGEKNGTIYYELQVDDMSAIVAVRKNSV